MPYADYSNFDQTYFEGRSVDNPHEAGYSDYRDNVMPFNDYAQYIDNRLTSNGIDPSGAKVLVTGCAYGYTVEYLIDQYNVDAYGMDISSYAVSEATNEIAYGGKIYQGSVLNSNDLKSIRQSTPGGKFKVIVNENLLSCLTDSEAQNAASNLRGEAQSTVVHTVWVSDKNDYPSNWYNAKTLSEWQSLIDPNGDDLWIEEPAMWGSQ